MARKNVKCIPFPEIDNAYVVISAFKSKNGNGLTKCMSFFFDHGDIGAEWEPDNGPITVIYKCAEDNKDAQEHWFYDYCTGYGNWSQLAVQDEGLHTAFLSGDYVYLFAVLQSWSNR